METVTEPSYIVLKEVRGTESDVYLVEVRGRVDAEPAMFVLKRDFVAEFFPALIAARRFEGSDSPSCADAFNVLVEIGHGLRRRMRREFRSGNSVFEAEVAPCDLLFAAVSGFEPFLRQIDRVRSLLSRPELRRPYLFMTEDLGFGLDELRSLYIAFQREIDYFVRESLLYEAAKGTPETFSETLDFANAFLDKDWQKKITFDMFFKSCEAHNVEMVKFLWKNHERVKYDRCSTWKDIGNFYLGGEKFDHGCVDFPCVDYEDDCIRAAWDCPEILGFFRSLLEERVINDDERGRVRRQLDKAAAGVKKEKA